MELNGDFVGFQGFFSRIPWNSPKKVDGSVHGWAGWIPQNLMLMMIIMMMMIIIIITTIIIIIIMMRTIIFRGYFFSIELQFFWVAPW